MPTAPLRILLVENHTDTRVYLALYLESSGHRVTSAASVAEALDLAPESDCQVLISDIGLPDGTGWDFLQQAHFTHPVYAIALSGYGMARDREKSTAAGFRHHLVKPIRLEQLDTLLADAASSSPG